MNWEIVFGGDPQDVTVKTAGVATRDGFHRMNGELVSRPEWSPGMIVLVDHTALDTSALAGRDIEEITDFVATLADRLGPAVVAIITPGAYDRGVADVSVQHVRGRMPLRASAFSSREEAVRWLDAQKARRAV